MTLRTVARDTDSVRTISLIVRPCSKYARRISPILSTPIIPISPSRPIRAKRKDADTTHHRGSELDAKAPLRGSILQAILHVNVLADFMVHQQSRMHGTHLRSRAEAAKRVSQCVRAMIKMTILDFFDVTALAAHAWENPRVTPLGIAQHAARAAHALQ